MVSSGTVWAQPYYQAIKPTGQLNERCNGLSAGPEDPRCLALIEAHKVCLRSEGFKVRSRPRHCAHPSLSIPERLSCKRTAADAGMTEPAYFERQSRQLCLRHTINNLFQRRAVTAAELDALAAELPDGGRWFGPHRTLWLGNYGVSVVELALAKLGKVRCSLTLGPCPAVQWHRACLWLGSAEYSWLPLPLLLMVHSMEKNHRFLESGLRLGFTAC